jgi:hypothetical protein
VLRGSQSELDVLKCRFRRTERLISRQVLKRHDRYIEGGVECSDGLFEAAEVVPAVGRVLDLGNRLLGPAQSLGHLTLGETAPLAQRRKLDGDFEREAGLGILGRVRRAEDLLEFLQKRAHRSAPFDLPGAGLTLTPCLHGSQRSPPVALGCLSGFLRECVDNDDPPFSGVEGQDPRPV